MSKTGRPSKELDWELFEKICAFPLRQEDMAFIMGCSLDLLAKRARDLEDCTLSEFVDKRRSKLRLRILNKQYEIAMSGNVTMLIWTGKQFCGQTEKTEMLGNNIQPIQLRYNLDDVKKAKDQLNKSAEAIEANDSKSGVTKE